MASGVRSFRCGAISSMDRGVVLQPVEQGVHVGAGVAGAVEVDGPALDGGAQQVQGVGARQAGQVQLGDAVQRGVGGAAGD